MKLNKMQLEAVASTVVDRINKQRNIKREALKNSTQFKSEVKARVKYLESFTEEEIKLIKRCTDNNGEVSKSSVENFVFGTLDTKDLNAISNYGSEISLIKNEVILSTVNDMDIESVIESLVKKFSI